LKKCIKCGFERDYKLDPCECGEPRYQIVRGVGTARKVAKAVYDGPEPRALPSTIGEALFDNHQEVRVVDPTTGGAKGQKIERFDLIPFEALTELATIYGIGAKKYSDDNWRKGYAWRLSLGAMFRHLALWVLGQSYDAETGRHHLMHAAWHCFTLFIFETQKLGTDDRAIIRRDQTGT
jgi:hypothetical protein